MQPTETATGTVRYDVQLLTEQDLYLFNEGSNYRTHEKMGAHILDAGGEVGTCFSVWAPNAREVSVIGSFNHWHPKMHRLRSRGSSGIWEGFIPGVGKGTLYKFHIESHHHGHLVDKADPFGLMHEKPPRTASVVWDLNYEWNDRQWMETRAPHNSLKAPVAVYECHLGSWMRLSEDHNRPLTYRETAPKLAEYLNQMGFTHVEFLPVPPRCPRSCLLRRNAFVRARRLAPGIPPRLEALHPQLRPQRGPELPD